MQQDTGSEEPAESGQSSSTAQLTQDARLSAESQGLGTDAGGGLVQRESVGSGEGRYRGRGGTWRGRERKNNKNNKKNNKNNKETKKMTRKEIPLPPDNLHQQGRRKKPV